MLFESLSSFYEEMTIKIFIEKICMFKKLLCTTKITACLIKYESCVFIAFAGEEGV